MSPTSPPVWGKIRISRWWATPINVCGQWFNSQVSDVADGVRWQHELGISTKTLCLVELALSWTKNYRSRELEAFRLSNDGLMRRVVPFG
jgi:hypothetical protein